ncbi:hypothetical protein D104_14960 [Marinomonas profundimaris]|uniref:Uncharacterized protein n=1 Tax=Marinomonas profundimaris TaxID=1208321 RepID=W1RUB4_9GAMM|nr:hypothetical protein D104_14960 [Marinomonas profundimaris]
MAVKESVKKAIIIMMLKHILICQTVVLGKHAKRSLT